MWLDGYPENGPGNYFVPRPALEQVLSGGTCSIPQCRYVNALTVLRR